MIDPVQAPTVVAPSAPTVDPSTQFASTDNGAVASAQKSAEPATSAATAQAAQAAQSAGSNGSSAASDSQSNTDAGPPLRLLIEHDKSTNQYVYKLYDSSGRIVREIPQESLADAQKQASGAPGALFDTTV
jgi:uncharacterized FlaG/YvyC family protein